MHLAPAPACGTFYSCLTTFRNFWSCVLVKSSECPHISQTSIEINRQMWGEHSPQFRQRHLAEFTSDDEEAFIPMETVRGCVDNPPLFQGGRRAAFVDWSTGGDETVIATAEGNRLRIAAAFRERDAVQVVRRVAHTSCRLIRFSPPELQPMLAALSARCALNWSAISGFLSHEPATAARPAKRMSLRTRMRRSGSPSAGSWRRVK
jgi:hypothetical protein